MQYLSKSIFQSYILSLEIVYMYFSTNFSLSYISIKNLKGIIERVNITYSLYNNINCLYL